MVDMEQRKVAEDVIYLARCAVQSAVPGEDRIRDMNLDAVCAFASKHMIGAAVAMGLEAAGVKNQLSRSAINVAFRRTAMMDKAWDEIAKLLDKNDIWYMPLKGTVLKDYYPRYGMREMSDHDILFNAERAEDVKAMMESLGFEAEQFGSRYHDCYYKKPILNFEMHRTLFDARREKKLYEYYLNVQERLIGNGCEKHFSSEDFYLYMTAHEYKHYRGGGTGLRSLLDTYVYLSRQPLDMNYVAVEAEKLGILEFEEMNRSLSVHLFSDGNLTEADQEMLDYILSSGTYGTITHKVENKMQEKGWGKIRYALGRFFVPVSRENPYYDVYSSYFPFFYKHKILLPVLPFYRTFRALKNGKFRAEVKAIKDAGR